MNGLSLSSEIADADFIIILTCGFSFKQYNDSNFEKIINDYIENQPDLFQKNNAVIDNNLCEVYFYFNTLKFVSQKRH